MKKVDAELIDRASVLLSADRRKAGDQIDFAVGVSRIKKNWGHVESGEPVERNEPLLLIYARTNRALASVLPMLDKATQVT